MKKILQGTALLGLSLTLAACGQSNEASTEGNTNAEGKVELDFWSFWGSEPRRGFVEHLVEDFNNSQDEIHVTHTYLPWGDIWTKNLASIAAGEPADVIVNDINDVRHRADKNQNTNLTEFIAQEDENFQEKFYPQLWDATVHEGESYALPFTTETRLLYYNKDMMEEVGLDPNTPPETWNELQDMAMQMDIQNDNGSYERIGYVPRYNIQGDLYYMNATGHGWWDHETDQPTINNPKGVEILEWMKDYEDHYGSEVINAFSAEFGNQQADPFMNGQIGMMVNSANHYSQIAEYAPDMNFGVAPLPELEPGNGNTSWGGGFVLEIPAGADNPEASWEFMKYLTDNYAQEYWATHNFDSVANIEAAENALSSEKLDEKGQEVYQVAVDNMENTILTPIPIEMPDILSIINPELDRIYLGEKTPQEALDDAQEMAEQQVPQ